MQCGSLALPHSESQLSRARWLRDSSIRDDSRDGPCSQDITQIQRESDCWHRECLWRWEACRHASWVGWPLLVPRPPSCFLQTVIFSLTTHPPLYLAPLSKQADSSYSPQAPASLTPGEATALNTGQTARTACPASPSLGTSSRV